MDLLKQSEETLEVLEVRAIPGEVELSLQLSRLKSLTLDQGIHLSKLCKFHFFFKNSSLRLSLFLTPVNNSVIILFCRYQVSKTLSFKSTGKSKI